MGGGGALAPFHPSPAPLGLHELIWTLLGLLARAEANFIVPDLGYSQLRHWVGLAAYVAWRAGTTTLCRSWLYPLQSGTVNSATWVGTAKRDSHSKGCSVPVPEFIDPRFRENKPKTLVFRHRKRAFWASFRENCVYNFGYRCFKQIWKVSKEGRLRE